MPVSSGPSSGPWRISLKYLRPLALALLLAAPATGNAAFTVTVQEASGPVIAISDGGALDADGLINGSITADTASLNALLTNFSFSSLGGTSSLLGGGPAEVTVSGLVTRLPGADFSTVTITSGDTGFTSGNPKSLVTSVSDTFQNTTSGDLRTFQGVFDATAAGGAFVTSPLFVFIPPNGAGPFNTSNLGFTTPLGVQPSPFDLTTTTVITLGPNPTSGIQSDQFFGSAGVTAPITPTPEPASLTLLATGAVTLLAFRRRKAV
ncbi:PEP-CTERM sorting domain-containing protein [Gemmata sp. G18]|uniref:PEP-CTERM sorting domain-containing protein n=1 Tax=Gemmata palustris TaxID=2822762 RepID=A0ABS5BXC7_9BACT|nr:PEP-CTERM sorting domain-containing protein [Gemmata palustris]MBP3958397.1 PEP-CTERM sorting domain-containing protein [Gemmata palustris]